MSETLLPDGVTVRRDLVHTRLDGYRPLSLDLYLPDSAPVALCVYAHGGGWRAGSRRAGPGPLSPTSGRLFGRLAASGLAVASVDYRLSGEAQFPSQLNDVAAALTWLRSDEAPQTRDLPLVMFGVSAGGLLANLTALDPAHGARAAAAWYAVSDLGAMRADQAAVDGPLDPPGRSREEMFLGGTADELPEVTRQASPVSHAHHGAPPFLLLHGSDDVLVPAQQSKRLADSLAAVDVDCTLELVSGYGHMFTGMADQEVEAHVDRTAEFLLSHI